MRSRALLYMLRETPGRLIEISTPSLEVVYMEAGAVRLICEGRPERWMPLGDAAGFVLWDNIQEREFLVPNSRALWVSERGDALLLNGIFQILKRLGKRAGIFNQHTQRFCHSYAIDAPRVGMPERVLEIVGDWKRFHQPAPGRSEPSMRCSSAGR